MKRLTHSIAAALLLAAAAAHAEIVDIAWSANGSFERSLVVAPGKFAEVAQDYCWLWVNKTGTSSKLELHLQKP